MLYTKYESSGRCSLRQEDFWKLHFENLFVTPWPTYAHNWNGWNNFDRGPPRDHSCDVWSKSNERFQRRRCLSNKVDGRRTTDDDGRRTKVGHNNSSWATNENKRSLTNLHPPLHLLNHRHLLQRPLPHYHCQY